MSKPPNPAAGPIPPRPRRSKYVEAIFTLDCPWAEEVYLAGDFNDWARATLPMRRNSRNGLWEKPLALVPGRYEYKFIIDGQWTRDPECAQNVLNTCGTLNSVKVVE
jgi:1,4-alpha-glucan branching enzyme